MNDSMKKKEDFNKPKNQVLRHIINSNELSEQETAFFFAMTIKNTSGASCIKYKSIQQSIFFYKY